MVNRRVHGIWDVQDITNRAIVERLQRDPEAVQCFEERLATDPTENECASLPRFLAAAGALNAHVVERCRSLLSNEAHHALPRAGYDAVDEATRAESRSLLDVLIPSLSR